MLVTSKHLLPYGVDRITPNRITEKDFKKINERSLVEQGDVLMSMIGTIGLISFVTEREIDYAIKNVALFKTSRTPNLAYYFLTFLKSNKTQQYRQVGNAVPPMLGKVVASEILKWLKKNGK